MCSRTAGGKNNTATLKNKIARMVMMNRVSRVLGADHILAQPLKWCSVSCIKPNETFELAKKRQNTLCFGVCGRKNFFEMSPSYKQSPKNRQKISLSCSFAVEMGHFDMVRWKCNSVDISSMLWDTLELILWKKADKKCKDQKRSIIWRRVLWQERVYFKYSE